jgi:ferredoxin
MLDSDTPEIPLVRLESGGVVLIYGRDERAIEAANLIKAHLDITVLLKPAAEVAPPRSADFPIAQGAIRAAQGYLGAFEITVDEFAESVPAARGNLLFGRARDGAVSRCDIFIDLSGGVPFFPGTDLRDGYLRADPDHPAAVLTVLLKARDLVGTFDKPRYIALEEHLCAHSRSRITGCTRCLDLCPTGAIKPNGDHVLVDPYVCAGCGECSAACPTGAVAYTVPPSDALIRKLRTVLMTWHEEGGQHAVVLFHDDPHGGPLIEALTRFGAGLPTHVLPVCVNEVTQIGLEALAAVFAFGASAVRLLLRERSRHGVEGLSRTVILADSILVGLGFGAARVATIETDDPDTLGETLRAIPALPPAPRMSTFRPIGDKRSVLRFALQELHRAAFEPVDTLPLPAGAPFGAVAIDTQGCTLCLSCVSACPTGALRDDPEKPALRFAEEACVQCGLCKSTCPEKVITLLPRLNFRAVTDGVQVLKQEEPFCCIRCGKPFGVRSTIEKVTAKLAGKHWMFKDEPGRLDLIQMCDDCRVAYVTEREFDPHASPRAPVRTTDDYLREPD